MGFVKVFIENNTTKNKKILKKNERSFGAYPYSNARHLYSLYIIYLIIYILFEDSYLLFLIIYMYIYAVFSKNYSLITFLVVVLSSIVIRK